MTRGRLLRLGLSGFDVVLILGVALVPVLAWRGIRTVEVGLIPLLLAPFVWRRVLPDRNDWLTIALFAQYALLVALNIAVYPLINSAEMDVVGSKLGLYLGAALLLLLMVLRLRMTLDAARIWRVVAPIVVIGSAAVLGWDHLRTGDCRVGFLSKHLLIPPLWLTVFAVAGYHGWSRMASGERWLRHLALTSVIVATVAFSGGRAMLGAQAVTIPLLALLLGWEEPLRRRLRPFVVLGLVSFGAFGAGLVVDMQAGCGFSQRLVAIARTIDRGGEDAKTLAERAFADKFAQESPVAGTEPEGVTQGATEKERQQERTQTKAEKAARKADLTSEDRLIGAVYIRFVLWSEALKRIGEAPLLGHGHLNEPALITGDFPHFHEQYLSWLVWGGVPMLVSGLAMLFAPLFTFGIRRSQDGAVLALAMIAPLGVSFLAATNLMHTVMLLGYVMTLALLHRLARGAPHEAVERSGIPPAAGYMGRL